MVSTGAGLVRGEEYTGKRRYTANWTTRWQLEHVGARWSTLEHAGARWRASIAFYRLYSANLIDSHGVCSGDPPMVAEVCCDCPIGKSTPSRKTFTHTLRSLRRCEL